MKSDESEKSSQKGATDTDTPAEKPKSPAMANIDWRDIGGQAFTLAVGALGAVIFLSLNIPGGSMSGAVVAVTLLSVFNLAHGLGRPPTLRCGRSRRRRRTAASPAGARWR